MIQTQIIVKDSYGQTVDVVSQYNSLEYSARLDGGISAFSMTLPKYYKELFNSRQKDYRLQIWRSANNNPFKLEGKSEYLCTNFFNDDNVVRVSGESIQSLLKRRIIAYPAGITNLSQFTGYTGDIMKEIVRTNFGTSINSSLRDGNEIYANISQYITIAPNKSDGIIQSIGCSRRNVFDTISDLAQSSWQAGQYCVGIITSNGNDLMFDTYANQVGTVKNIVLSTDTGSAQNFEIERNRIDEITFAIAGGAGTEQARIIQTAYDAIRIGESAFNRLEAFYENTQIKNTTFLSYLAQSSLQSNRGVTSASCDVIQTKYVIRGISYELGDYLPVYFDGIFYTMRLDIVNVSISDGQYTERVQLRI
jgi:hypothetical protein